MVRRSLLAVLTLALAGCLVGSLNVAGTKQDDAGTTTGSPAYGTTLVPYAEATSEIESSYGEDADITTYEDDATSDPAGFIMIGGDHIVAFECDLFAQDCPRGQKCTAWSNDGDVGWNATRCVPVVADPAGMGEPCTVQDHPWSGIDDCDQGLVCWAVGDDLVGRCEDWCTGTADNGQCADENDTCILCQECFPLCLTTCDPLAQDCARQGDGCYAISSHWVCVPDASGELGTHGDPCQSVAECDPGSVCIGAVAFTNCQGAFGCCTPICDITDRDADAMCASLDPGQTCEQLYAQGNAPAGYESVGACLVPQ